MGSAAFPAREILQKIPIHAPTVRRAKSFVVDFPQHGFPGSNSGFLLDLSEDRRSRCFTRFSAAPGRHPVRGPGGLRIHPNEQDTMSCILDAGGDTESEATMDATGDPPERIGRESPNARDPLGAWCRAKLVDDRWVASPKGRVAGVSNTLAAFRIRTHTHGGPVIGRSRPTSRRRELACHHARTRPRDFAGRTPSAC